MTFRSLQMSHFKLLIPRMSAYLAMDTLGQENLIHIVPNKSMSDRPFHQMVKRCEEGLQKIQVLQSCLKEANIDYDEYQSSEPLFFEKCLHIWKQEANKLGVDQPKLLEVYENQLNQEFQEYQSLSLRLDKMKKQRTEILETIACLETIKDFFGDGAMKRQSVRYYVDNVAQSNAMNGVSYMVGVITPQSQMRLSKMVYRVSRGYACTKTISYEGQNNLQQKVMLIIYPTSDSMTLQKKLRKVLETFSERYFIMNQIQKMPDLMEYKQKYIEVQNLWEMTTKQFYHFTQKIKNVEYIEKWRLFLWKEKALYEALGDFEIREQFYLGQIYIPTQKVDMIALKLNRIVPAPTIQHIPLGNPPTAYHTNSYTAISQEIVDTYGVPRYQEMNPTIFTTVTFPFFFGVMFGDILHGGLLFFLGIYLVFNNERISKSSLKFICQLRYMITLMGFFAFYCGFIYNDIIGFNINLFSSCYDPPYHPDPSHKTQIEQVQHAKPDCVYPFGIDPIWGRAQNELNYVNSLKMKLSVIIAILHMSFGIFLKATNSLYFKKTLDFVCEFIPQFIFMVLLFGYMDFLIIFKWLKPWNVMHDQKTPPQQWAPSIISTMMNIGLDMGETGVKPDGNSNMWGQVGNSSQDIVQLIILIIAFICIPWMLLPKPIIEINQLKKVKHQSPLKPRAEFEQDSSNELKKKLNPSSYQSEDDSDEHSEEHDSSQIFVHQLIQTIEFALGAVSNTASYLRLWALSLAHGQLSKVFFNYTVGVTFGIQYVEIVGMIGGFFLLAWITFGIIMCMDSMQCFLHSLRLHWVQFQNKFFKGDGYRYCPLNFEKVVVQHKQKSVL